MRASNGVRKAPRPLVGLGAVLLLSFGGVSLARAGQHAEPARGCGAGTLHGRYATHGTGEVLGAPFGLVGRFTFTPGGVTGRFSETKLVAGNVERTTLTGTWSLDEQCQGEMTIRVAHEDYVDHHRLDLYVADGGGTIYWILTNTWFDLLHVGEVAIDLDPAGLNEALVGSITSDRHGGVLSGVARRL